MLSDDVAVGTVINVTSSEVVEFIVLEQTAGDLYQHSLTYNGEESTRAPRVAGYV